jgi:hypothetical protein
MTHQLKDARSGISRGFDHAPTQSNRRNVPIQACHTLHNCRPGDVAAEAIRANQPARVAALRFPAALDFTPPSHNPADVSGRQDS